MPVDINVFNTTTSNENRVKLIEIHLEKRLQFHFIINAITNKKTIKNVSLVLEFAIT